MFKDVHTKIDIVVQENLLADTISTHLGVIG